VADEFVTSGWYDLLMHGRVARELMLPGARGVQAVFKRLPGDLRCRICHVPFNGPGARIASLSPGSRPSSFSMQLCRRCEVRARGEKTGADVEIASVFADIRGSTQLAIELGSQDYRDLIDRFYTTATDVLVASEAIIEKLVGDQVAAIFVPGLAGEHYVQRAVDAALAMQAAFGAGSREGAWVRVGIWVHAGGAFVGVVGTMGGMTELTVLGDVPNVTARLAGAAASGEILVTEAAMSRVRDVAPVETRTLQMKGRDDAVTVGVLAA